MLVDSHCHLLLLDQAKQGETAAVIQRAVHSGVTRLLNVAVTPADWPALAELSQAFPQVYHSIGVHPCHAEEQPSAQQWLTALSHPRVIALGETGLDYYWEPKDKIGDLQKQRFVEQISYAKTSNKPLIIHSRNAQPDTLDVLAQEGADSCGAVMHCFVDDWPSAKRALDLGFYISFSGIVTFKTATQVQDVAMRVPLDRLLVETDAPYLAPVPHRGKSNEPAFTRHVAEFLAKLRGETFEQLAQATSQNFNRLFHLS